MNKVICVDDYGEEIYRCHWSSELVKASESTASGSFVPGVRVTYTCKADHKEAKKKKYRDFADAEANCNTCLHLERIKHDKDPFGFITGRCNSVPVESMQLIVREDMIVFHPDDWMGMGCYVSRF